jgi:hypothetical protein
MPEFPESLRKVWHYFFELCAARTSGMNGADPLIYSEIAAWDKLTGAQITPAEVAVIKKLDYEYMSHQAEKAKKESK